MESFKAETTETTETSEKQAASLDAAMDALADGVLVSDARGVQRCNPAALRLLQTASLADLQVPPHELVQLLQLRLQRHGPLLQPAELPFGNLLCASPEPSVVQLWGKRRTMDAGSSDVCLRCAVSRIVVDGQVVGSVAVVSDLSDRPQFREQGQQGQQGQDAKDVKDAKDAKDKFLATMSHELRTPLSTILGWAHVLEHSVRDPETLKHGLAAISRNARLQVQLIEDLLDMNRLESGELRLDLQRIELGSVIAAAFGAALPAASAKRIGLRTVLGAGSAVLTGDAARLQQVVAKLLNNAIKFTPDGGQISVSLSQREGFAQIDVEDNGQGIEPEFLVRMFKRFEQQDATITRRHGGLGIGLAIAWHLVQLHGGSVRAHSLGPGQGATFTVLLPLTGPAGSADPVRRPAPPTLASTAPPATNADADAHANAHVDIDADVTLSSPTRLAGISVLLVDDEPDVRDSTSRLLQTAGARVVAAASAEEALSCLHAERHDVLLSDIGMPQVDGYALMRRVRELPPDAGGLTPAAAFTAYTRPEDRARALAAGYQLHLAKPVAPAALLDAVAALAHHGGH